MSPAWRKLIAKNQVQTATVEVKMPPPQEGVLAVIEKVEAANEEPSQALGHARKQATVTEMLEYVRGLDIDPVKEADMLWIAEEALNAPLPPGWTEHTDERGCIYFHNSFSGESCWRHPMDNLFRDVVCYQRQVVNDNGFWNVEDEIALLEEDIRKGLQDWMELYDEHGEKFFYSRMTNESRFDDPRMGQYHQLYARVKMVAKMKERLPRQANNKRPEMKTEKELAYERKRSEDERKYLEKVIRLQTFIRIIIAKRRVRLHHASAIIAKGSQPLRGQMRLKLERVGRNGQKELVLSQTTGTRRHRAAVKVQARVRGILARKRFRPMVLHRLHLSHLITRVQSRARVWLAIRRCARLRQLRRVTAATDIQRVFRGYKDRQYVDSLMVERARFLHLMKCVVKIQSLFRMGLAHKDVRRRLEERRRRCAALIARHVHMLSARICLQREAMMQEISQTRIVFTLDKRQALVCPFSIELRAAPWEFGHAPTEEEKAECKFVDLFWKENAGNFRNVAARRIQLMARARLARKRVRRLRECTKDVVLQAIERTLVEVDLRQVAIVKIQKIVRGHLCRVFDVRRRKRLLFLKKKVAERLLIQSFFMKNSSQHWLDFVMRAGIPHHAAIVIQTRWRGFLARRHADNLRRQCVQPLRGFFSYVGTGPDCCQVKVCFPVNLLFDEFRFFQEFGDYSVLDKRLEEMEASVEENIGNFVALGGDESMLKAGSSKEKTSQGGENKSKKGKKGNAQKAVPVPTPSKAAAAAPVAAQGSTSSVASNARVAEELAPATAGKVSAPAASVAVAQAMTTASESAHSLSACDRVAVPAVAAASVAPPAAAVEGADPQGSAGAGTGKAKASAMAAPPQPGVAAATPAHLASKGATVAEPAPDSSTTQKQGAGAAGALQFELAPPVNPIGEGEVHAAAADLATTGSATPLTASNKAGAKRQEQAPASSAPDKAAGITDAGGGGTGETQGGAPEAGLAPDSSPAQKDPAEVPAPAGPAPLGKGEAAAAGGAACDSSSPETAEAKVAAPASEEAAAPTATTATPEIQGRKGEEEPAVKGGAVEGEPEHVSYPTAKKVKAPKPPSSNPPARAGFPLLEEKCSQEELERREKRVLELKKWLKLKEEQSRQRRERDEMLMAQIREEAEKKAEAAKRLEEQRIKERERRLKIADKQKKELEEQLAATRAAREAKRAGLHLGNNFAGLSVNSEPMSELAGASTSTVLGSRDLLSGSAYPANNFCTEQPGIVVPIGQVARVLHRHIHHHVHYGNQDRSGSPEGDRDLELASENRVRAQLERGGPMVDPMAETRTNLMNNYAATPTMQQNKSFGFQKDVDINMQRTQEAFPRVVSLPALPTSGRMNITAQKMVGYQKSVQRAFDSYADTRRPRFIQLNQGR